MLVPTIGWLTAQSIWPIFGNRQGLPFTSGPSSRFVPGVTLALITETTLTAAGMQVGYFLESHTSVRGYRRTTIWSRLIEWPTGMDIADDVRVLGYAEDRLKRMGLRPLSTWWFFDDPVPYWYACLERIPGSTATWRD